MSPRRKTPRRFVAIDGEAIDGNYCLIAWSDGEGNRATKWSDESGLSTLECFDFLMDCKRKNPKTVFVCFGLNYDVNMILRDFKKEQLETLWKEGEIWVSLRGASYNVKWIPRKMFSLYSPDRRTSIRVYDCFGFFQSSFVKALEAWKIEDPFGEVKAMKQERSRFDWKEKRTIEKYCLSECDLLCELMNRLEFSMKSAKIHLRSYMGAGSVAGALLQKEKVKPHRVSDTTYPEHVQYAIHCAYFGGRIEVFLQGSLANVVNYDIVSAYPAQSLQLPTLTGGKWRRGRKAEVTTNHALSLWEVEWDIPKEDARFVMPFPLRRNGAIYYPRNGRGWYHGIEVRAALQLHPNIKVLRGYVFEPVSDEKPFAFVRDYFEARREAKARGDAAEKAYKLGLNSLYGKLAQGISANGEPPFRSLVWAGRITAGTRAKLLDAASLNPAGVVSMATDGIVFTSDPQIVPSNQLGGWEKTEIDSLFIAQPGIYRMRDAEGKEVRKSRGFFTREIDYEDLEEGWLTVGSTYTQRAVCECGHVHKFKTKCGKGDCDCRKFSRRRRFIGLGTALMREDFSVWRTWQESERILSLTSSRKFYEHERPVSVIRLLPPGFPDIVPSEPYVPKTRTIEERAELLEMLQGFEQPLGIED